MNGAAQRERHTVVGQLARDTETVLTATVANMNARFAAVKAETDTLKAEIAKLREVQELVGAQLRFLTLDVGRLDAVRSRNLWGRLTWLVRGQ